MVYIYICLYIYIYKLIYSDIAGVVDILAVGPKDQRVSVNMY